METGDDMSAGHHAESVARKKLGVDNSWEVCGWTIIGDRTQDRDCIMRLGVPRVLKSGPNKGGKTWRDSEILECVVTWNEVEQEMKRYEIETGNCVECLGTSNQWAGWSKDLGMAYKPCEKCKATGKAVMT